MAHTSPSLHRPLSRSLRVYQRIALGFVGITFLMLLAVVYLSVSRATITVVANPSVVATTASLAVVKSPTGEGQIAGSVGQTTLTNSRIFSLPQEGARAVEAKSSGIITVLNNTGSAQQLVETTRFLSQSGVLFRLDTGVTVPANGQVTARITADQAGASGDIDATTFTIPGLATSLQDKIYGTSTVTMTGGVQYVRTLTDTDVADAKTALLADILSDAKVALSTGLDASLAAQGTYSVEEDSVTTDVPVGTETGTFSLTITATVTGVYYDSALVASYARSLLQKRVPEGFVLNSVSEQGVQTTVESANYATGEAQLSLYLDGTAVISADAPTLSKDRFLGRAPNEVFTLLRSSDAISDVAITFTPFWLQRIPTLKDHIEIIIKTPEAAE
ncbi:MAG: hypothetical protein AAB448_00260 [Patescibacteria group bacterium]